MTEIIRCNRIGFHYNGFLNVLDNSKSHLQREIPDNIFPKYFIVDQTAELGLRRGYFLQTDAGKEATAMTEELGSPVIAFVREWCELKPGRQTQCPDLYVAYKRWCEEAGRGQMGRNRFYADFASAYPECKRSKNRNSTTENRNSNIGTNPVWVFEGISLLPDYRPVGF
jgi:hypothetical protein